MANKADIQETRMKTNASSSFRLMKINKVKGGGSKKIEKQHAKGKLTARERLDRFFDVDLNELKSLL